MPFTVEHGHIRHQFSTTCTYLYGECYCLRLRKTLIQDGRWLAAYCHATFENCPRFRGRAAKPVFRVDPSTENF